jgi:hypothetical protein
VIDDVAYRTFHGVRVRGARVGRFAIRMRWAGARQMEFGRPTRPFVVDHINTGAILADVTNFDDALRIADDLSRFSRKDPSARSASRAAEQIGESVVKWAIACCNEDRHIPYREWLAARRQAA